MVAPRLKFHFTPSLWQRLSLLGVALLALASYLLWPVAYIPLFGWLKWALFGLTLGYFLWLWQHLKNWQCDFSVSADGSAFCVDGKPLDIKPVWISPLIILLHISDGKQTSACFIFRDMLSDSEYRSLCRWLYSHKKSGSTKAP
ncbi:protein YgfX [Shewanella sp. GXUN23E]|uniref:protein YgfX n=1 Tax=Shewanella sp. GXUN23E TaxID=3422498 RepID=UPI003D7E8BE7